MQRIDPLVARAIESGQSLWPGVVLEPKSFARRMRELGVEPRDLTTRGADLFLAWACAEHDPAALSHFEKTFLQRVNQYVARLGLPDDVVDDVRQELRIRLLTGTEPRIGAYAGRGALGAWVRVSAIRTALNWTEQNKVRAASDAEVLGALVSDRPGPELAALKGRYGGVFQAALDRSLQVLGPRDKTLLRMHFVDGLNIDTIGTVYRVHRATVARWLVDIRKRVFATLREELSLEIDATSSEFRSMLTIVKDDLDLSVQRVLRSRG
jgi:RNA polymerase sigma-70 factor (ECF subfamily)